MTGPITEHNNEPPEPAPEQPDATAPSPAEKEFRRALEREVRRLRANRRVQMGLGAAYLITVVPAMVYYWSQGLPGSFGVVVLGFVALEAGIASLQRRTGRRLARLDDVRAVGPAVDVLASSGVPCFGGIQGVVAGLLLRVRASDAGLLTPRQRKHLRACLTADWYWPYRGRMWGPSLKIAILRALEQIGDEKDIPAVERLARVTRNPDVRRGAEECLPALRQRAEEQRHSSTLLRPATATDEEAAAHLLRPAKGGAASHEALVRPVSGEEGGPGP